MHDSTLHAAAAGEWQDARARHDQALHRICAIMEQEAENLLPGSRERLGVDDAIIRLRRKLRPRRPTLV